MNNIDVTAVLDRVDFSPPSKEAEILQNVRTILTTAKYSVPLDRQFGIDTEILDIPINQAQAKLTAEIIAAIEKYEPRVAVTKVLYSGDGADGRLLPTVKVMIL